MNDNTLILTGADVARHLTPAACIAAVETAFRLLGEGRIQPPQTMGVHVDHGGFHIKAGVLPPYFAAKLNGNFPGNAAAHGLPTIQGVLILSDANNGRVLAVMDSVELTARRTAAATAVAAKYLARADASSVLICGCGVQASAHLDALDAVMDIKAVVVCDVIPGRAEAFATEQSILRSYTVKAAGSIASVSGDADIIITCTTSTQYILHADDVRKGTFVAGVGVDNEHKRELHPALLARALVVTDDRAQCARIGDLHHAIESATLQLADVHADLADVVTGVAPRRTSHEEIFVFDSTGLGLQDVAAAATVFERLTGSSRTSPTRT